jgi:hypothetical protein
VLSPNVRREEGWPASSDPTADSVAPPNTSAPSAPIEDEPPTPAPAPTPDENDPADDTPAGKIARLDQRRAVHASD